MKKLILVIFLFFISSFAFSQSGWVLQNSGTLQDLNSVHFVDKNIGYIVGDSGKVLKTTDGGNNWNLGYISNPDILLDVFFVNSNTGYSVSSNGNYHDRLYKTFNGGGSWNVVLNPNDFNFYCVYFINANTGFIGGKESFAPGGTSAFIWRTIDGSSWDEVYWHQLSGVQGRNHIRTFSFFNQIGYAFEAAVGILKTTNGGGNFFIHNNNLAGVESLFFTSEDTGHAVGTNGMYYKTMTGGSPWLSRQITAGTLNSIYFTSPDTGYIVGHGGQIFKTSNAGENWNNQGSPPPTYPLNSVFFIDNNTGFAVGWNGRIIKTTTGGVSGIETISTGIPNKFSLCQNYPNPFNPVTNIRFDLPHSSHIKLIIYDALGREIATLINERLSSGSYEVDWDGSSYPSGVYFYKVETNEFIYVRKMVMIK